MLCYATLLHYRSSAVCRRSTTCSCSGICGSSLAADKYVYIYIYIYKDNIYLYIYIYIYTHDISYIWLRTNGVPNQHHPDPFARSR